MGVPAVRVVAVAAGNSALVVPATATDAGVGGVEAPLTHISAHVINPLLVGLFFSDPMCMFFGIILRVKKGVSKKSVPALK